MVPVFLAIPLAIGALFIARFGSGMYCPGLAMFAACVIGGFWFLKRYFDRIDASQMNAATRSTHCVGAEARYQELTRENGMPESQHGKEVRNEAILVSGLAAAAASVEFFRDYFHSQSLLIDLVGIVIVAGVVFYIVYWIDGRLEAIRRGQPISLARIGRIDGYWLDVVWKFERDAWKLHGGGIIKIESEGGERFNLSGVFYKRVQADPAQALDLDLIGHWTGTGYVYGDDGFVFDYKGGEGASIHRGVGYYDFYTHPVDEGDVAYTGCFLSDVMVTKQGVDGRKVTKSELTGFRQDNGLALLKAFMTRWPAERPHQPP